MPAPKEKSAEETNEVLDEVFADLARPESEEHSPPEPLEPLALLALGVLLYWQLPSQENKDRTTQAA